MATELEEIGQAIREKLERVAAASARVAELQEEMDSLQGIGAAEESAVVATIDSKGFVVDLAFSRSFGELGADGLRQAVLDALVAAKVDLTSKAEPLTASVMKELRPEDSDIGLSRRLVEALALEMKE